MALGAGSRGVVDTMDIWLIGFDTLMGWFEDIHVYICNHKRVSALYSRVSYIIKASVSVAIVHQPLP